MAKTPAIDALPWSADALDRLAELRQARDTIDRMTDEAVIECRTGHQSIAGIETDTLHDSNRERVSYAPASWAKIAAQLGVTRQVAFRKYRQIAGL